VPGHLRSTAISRRSKVGSVLTPVWGDSLLPCQSSALKERSITPGQRGAEMKRADMVRQAVPEVRGFYAIAGGKVKNEESAATPFGRPQV